MQPVEVTARFDAKGKIYPLRLVLEGQEHLVVDVGRRWQDETGLHILVILSGFEAKELIYQAGEARWFLNALPGIGFA